MLQGQRCVWEPKRRALWGAVRAHRVTHGEIARGVRSAFSPGSDAGSGSAQCQRPAGVCLTLAGVRKSVSRSVTGVRQTAEAVFARCGEFSAGKGIAVPGAEWGVGLLVSHLWGQHEMAPAALRALVGTSVQDETVIPPCLAAKVQSQTRACWPRFPVEELVEDLCSLTRATGCAGEWLSAPPRPWWVIQGCCVSRLH